MKRWPGAAGTLVLAAAVLAACGGSSDDGPYRAAADAGPAGAKGLKPGDPRLQTVIAD